MTTTNAVFRAKNTTETIDDAAPVVVGGTYPALQSVIVDTSATGDYIDINGKSAANSAPVSVRIPNGNANAVVSAGAEISVAEFALVEIVTAQENQAFLLGDAVEHLVFTRNRDQTMVFGDLNFMVPTNGGSSLQMRMGSGSMAISQLSTFWSNQQGGASEQTPNFTLTTSWRHFRQAGLNLTQHNNYQEGRFVANGWLYRIQVIVGSGWTGNRFTMTRWRLAGVKGDDGIDGVDGTSVDHVSQTAGDSSPGTSNTYTLWGDVAETLSLGTYDVPIPTPADSAKPLDDLIAEGSGSWTADEPITLNNGKTWNDLVADGYEKIFVSAKENSWRGLNVGGYFFLADVIRDGGAQVWTVASGSNRYELTLMSVTGTGTGFTVFNGTPGGHTDFKMWGIRAQKELVVINPADIVVDTTGAVAGDTILFQDDGAGGLELVKGQAPGGMQTVLLAERTGTSFTTGQTFTLAGGRTWQNVLDEFQFVYVNVGNNSLFTHDQSRQWHVSDLSTQNRDMAITDYQTFGSNGYHFRMRCPAGSSTTVLVDNDGSTMQVERIKIMGIK